MNVPLSLRERRALSPRPGRRRFVVRVAEPAAARRAIIIDADDDTELDVQAELDGVSAPGARVLLSHDPPFLRARVESGPPLEVRGVRFRDVLLEGGEQILVGATTLRITVTHEDDPTRFGGLVGVSAATLTAFARAQDLARLDSPFFVVGEAWTGRRALVHAVHDESARARSAIRVASCATLTAQDLCAALSATSTAGCGLLVLHDVGALPTDARALLRSAIGSAAAGDCRLACTFTVHPDAPPDSDPCAGLGGLGVATLTLPPLRERRADAFELARWWWRDAGRRDVLPDAIMRQLSTSLLVDNAEDVRAILLQEAGTLAQRPVDRLAFVEARRRALEEFELRYVAGALQRAAGNVTRASRASGLTRRYFHALMARAKRTP